MKLITPQSYLDATPAQRKSKVNGCGQKGLFGKLVPNTIWFLSIKEACQIHDWEYSEGKTIEDKKIADINFIKNMGIIIDNAGGFDWIKRLRRERAATYYFAVKYFGESAFWEGKDRHVIQEDSESRSIK